MYDGVQEAAPHATEDEVVAALRDCQYDPARAVAALTASAAPAPSGQLDVASLLMAQSPAAAQRRPSPSKKHQPKAGVGDLLSLMAEGGGGAGAPAAAPGVTVTGKGRALQTIARPVDLPPPTAPAPAAAPPLPAAPAPPSVQRSASTGSVAAAAAAGGSAGVAKAKSGPAFPEVVGSLPPLPEDVKAGVAAAKPVMNLVVVGHVDSGKSTTMGRFLVEVGQVSSRTIKKYRDVAATHGKASFAYAWVMDEGDEERARGVTVDVALKHFDTPGKHFTILDAPGHADFVPNMIAGAAQADIAILLVSAVESEYTAGFASGKGQTREHALLVRSFGISQIIVAVNKMDEVGWDKERYYAINTAVAKFLGTCGFKRSNVTFVPISGLNALNLVAPVSAAQGPGTPLAAPSGGGASAEAPAPPAPEFVPEASWYTGPTLLGALDAARVPKRAVEAPLRFCIWDVFRDKGLTVTGRIEAGVLQQHTSVVVHPNDAAGSVKSISCRGQATRWAAAGDIVDVVLGGGLDEHTVGPGKVLTLPSHPVPVVTKFRAQVLTLHALQVPLVKGQRLTLHTQSVEVPVTVTKLMYTMDRKGQCTAIKPRLVTRDCTAVLKLTLGKPTPLELYSTNKRMGRFTLRYSGTTVAAGMVIKISG